MTNAERMAILQKAFKLMFLSKEIGMDITQVTMQTNTGAWPGRWFKDSSTGQQTLRGFDFTCNLGDRGISLRCLEQNPNKTDKFGNLKKHAILARQGHKIMWVIDRNGSYLGGIIDGVWQPSFKPATTATKQNPPAPQNRVPENAGVPNNIPEIPDDVGIPEYVMDAFTVEDDPAWMEMPDWGNIDDNQVTGGDE